MTLDARYPVALLPVRLETRFAGSLLQVRIFPDEIFADTHETGSHRRRARGRHRLRRRDARWRRRRAGRVAATGVALDRAARRLHRRASCGHDRDARRELDARRAGVLPDHWVVRAYQGASVFTHHERAGAAAARADVRRLTPACRACSAVGQLCDRREP